VTPLTDRATVEEKAEAGDKVMGATGENAIGLMAAWVWLRDTVEAREAMLDEAERIAQERQPQHSDFDYGLGEDARPRRPYSWGH
jgi:hypothetical protein